MLVKPEEDEAAPFFRSETKINVKRTSENELFERATDKMIESLENFNKMAQIDSLKKSFHWTYCKHC